MICVGAVEFGSYIFSDLELLVVGKFLLSFLDVGFFNVLKGYRVYGAYSYISEIVRIN
jgi:hypothetical protein